MLVPAAMMHASRSPPSSWRTSTEQRMTKYMAPGIITRVSLGTTWSLAKVLFSRSARFTCSMVSFNSEGRLHVTVIRPLLSCFPDRIASLEDAATFVFPFSTSTDPLAVKNEREMSLVSPIPLPSIRVSVYSISRAWGIAFISA
eukprot:XP_001709525.1 Hypothetical protein GL50803_20301 [Giardia lamblia ATCC 50803]